MNRLIPLFILVNFVAIFTCSQLLGDIRLSHHDFSGSSWSGNEICRPCHTPHNANLEIQDSPLWNHENTTAVFQVYTSSTFDATPGQPAGKTKLCLSCHDGTVAIDNFGGNSGGTRFIGVGLIGTDLQKHHPVSITYDANLASIDGGLYDPTTTLSGLGGTIAEDMLDGGKLECTSCHDVHVSRNTQGCTGCHNMHGPIVTRTLSLLKSNDNSALCLTCHRK